MRLEACSSHPKYAFACLSVTHTHIYTHICIYKDTYIHTYIYIKMHTLLDIPLHIATPLPLPWHGPEPSFVNLCIHSAASLSRYTIESWVGISVEKVSSFRKQMSLFRKLWLHPFLTVTASFPAIPAHMLPKPGIKHAGYWPKKALDFVLTFCSYPS